VLVVPDVPGVPLDVVGSATQVDWQVAACELQFTMQRVVVEVCAKWIDLSPSAAAAVTAQTTPMANAAKNTLIPRTSTSLSQAPRNITRGAAKCAGSMRAVA